MLNRYTKPKCFYCKQLKKQLKLWGYAYNEVNLDTDPRCDEHMMKNGHTTFPQLYWSNTDVQCGHSTELTKELLDERLAACQ